MPIKSSSLRFAYSPSKEPKWALDDVSFSIEEGEFVALVGRTGCGKSTLVQHLNALLSPYSGQIEIDDFVNDSSKKKKGKLLFKLRENVGMVFQFSEMQLFDETVEKDVAFGPKNFGSSAAEALEKAHQALLTVGLDESFWKRSPFDLSGGEKRRAAIAGVLAYSPKYIVLDEPTAGLDPNGAGSLMDLFKKINESGVTILFVTHDMDLVLGYADKVLVLNDGKLAKVGTPREIFEENMEQYSLETPKSLAFARILKEKGFNINPNECETVESLARQISKGMEK